LVRGVATARRHAFKKGEGMSAQRDGGVSSKGLVVFGCLGIAFCLFSLFCLISTGDAKDPTYVSSVILAFAICGGIVRRGRR
jgi:hypothetical protein